MSFRDDVAQHIQAGTQALWITTFEESRVLPDLHEVLATKRKQVLTWSAIRGLFTVEPEPNRLIPPDAGLKGALEGLAQNKGAWAVTLCDPHEHFNAAVNRHLRELFFTRDNISVLFISPKDTVPFDLTHQVTKLRYRLPSEEELIEMVRARRVAPQQISPLLAEAAVGLTLDEARVAMELALLRHGKQNPQDVVHDIWKLKADQLQSIGLLGIDQPKETWADVGGLYAFKQWFDARLTAFTLAAQRDGVPVPRGIILVGPPGTAKSLVGRVTANRLTESTSRRWNYVEIDFGRVMGPFVGETEERTRQLFDTLLALRPVVARIDEISHQVRGFESSGFTDSGVAARMIHSVLTFMQERDPGIFMVATTNEPWHMPPQMTRRFDAVFYFGLPRVDEMMEILTIHLKRHASMEGMAIKELATKMVELKFSGSEAEQAIIAARQITYPKKLTQPAIEKSMTAISPAAIVMDKDFEKIDEWGRTRAILASSRL